MRSLIYAVIGAAFLLAACERRKAASPDSAHEHAGESMVFNKASGLKLSDAARDGMGIETAGVGTAAVTRSWAVDAIVFRAAGERTIPGKYRGDSAYASLQIPKEGKMPERGRQFELQATGKSHRGVVVQVAGVPPEVLVEIPDSGKTLPVGTALTAELSEPGAGEQTAIPGTALLQTPKGSFVYVENGGAFLRTPVETGARQQGKVVITDGLYEGDVVVTQGAQALYLAELQAVNAGTGCTHGH